MVAVDGVTWDYSASFQVIAERYATIEAYLERFGNHYLAKGRVARWKFTRVRGLRALEASVVAHDELAIEQFVFIEAGDGRLIVVMADSSVEDAAVYVPWFEAALGSLEIWGASETGAGDADEAPR
jgi:hypothetical protein